MEHVRSYTDIIPGSKIVTKVESFHKLDSGTSRKQIYYNVWPGNGLDSHSSRHTKRKLRHQEGIDKSKINYLTLLIKKQGKSTNLIFLVGMFLYLIDEQVNLLIYFLFKFNISTLHL